MRRGEYFLNIFSLMPILGIRNGLSSMKHAGHFIVRSLVRFIAIYILCLGTVGCSHLMSWFGEGEVPHENIAGGEEDCFALGTSESVGHQRVCIGREWIVLDAAEKITKFPRGAWEEFLKIHVLKWLKTLDLSPNSDAQMIVYIAGDQRLNSVPRLYVDVDNIDWLIRFSVDFDPDFWTTTFSQEFFLDRAFVRPKPYSGKLLVEWKNQKAKIEVERIIGLYDEARVARKQGLTWELQTELTAWQDFARYFLNSPYIKERLSHWQVIPYSVPLEMKKKFLDVRLSSFAQGH